MDCVVIVNTEKDEDETEEKDEFPRLVLTFAGSTFVSSKVLADKCTINTQANDVEFAAVVLIASYYVFNVEYPLVWQNFLGLLQHVIVQQNYIKASSSSAFSNKLSEIESLMEKETTVFNGLGKQL